MNAVIKLEILCNERTLELHLKSIKQLIENYLLNQAYDDYEFRVEVESGDKK